MTIQEFFGTLQESVTAAWRKHLQTDKYSTHMALDEFYTEMPEKVDALIEAWQADHDVVEDYTCVLDAKEFDSIGYLKELKRITKEGRELMDSSELESLCDDVLGQIDSTLYKLQHLKEGLKGISEFLRESILDPNFNGPDHNDMTVDAVNSRRNPKGGKITADSWGHPVKVGDYIIGNADCPSIRTDVTNWLTGNNLVVGRIVAMHNGGLDVWILDNSHVDPDELKGNARSWGVSTCNTYGGVIVTVKTKTGFIKVDPKLIRQLFL